MRDTPRYARIPGIDRPGKVMDIELDLPHDEVRVRVPGGFRGAGSGGVPGAGAGFPGAGFPGAGVAATQKHVPSAEQKIAFDKFHVAPHLGDAIDEVRRREHKRWKAEGDERLAGTRYLRRKHPDNVSNRDGRGRFPALRESTRQTARAWAMREAAMSLWHDRSRVWATPVWATQVWATQGWATQGWATQGWATGAWQRGYARAIRSRLEPVPRVACRVPRHLPGIVHAVVLEATHAGGESINNRIQRVQCVQRVQRVQPMACGIRNTQRLQRAIYFHLAALDMHPPSPRALSTPTKA